MDIEVIKSSRRVQALLLHEMKHGRFKCAARLPRESVLAEQLSISRTQLRDALAELEREGYISRRHGVGTQINRHVVDIAVRMDIEIEFMDMVAESGYAPAERILQISRVCDAGAAKRLGVADESELLLVSRVVTANGLPVIYCEDYIPCAIITNTDFDNSELERPIFHFLSEFCGRDAYMDVTEVGAIAANGAAAEALGQSEGTPLLYMDEVDYDIDGFRIMYARQYYANGIIAHSVVRQKL